MREMQGPSVVLVQVSVTDPRVRFDRMRQRGEERDTDSYQRFLDQDSGEEQLFHVEEAAMMADYSLTNDGSLQDLHRKIEDLVARAGLLTTG
jgi:dephospho-CoA kinase